MKSFASAPAKAILFGEHFILYGCPALSMAITLYSKTFVEKRHDFTIQIYSKNLNLIKKFNENSNNEALKSIKLAVDEVLKLYNQNLGLSLIIESEIPPAAGLGSSAATAVSTIAATAELFNLNLTKDKIIELAFSPEKFIHGKPSGIDHTTSTLGGIIYYEPNSGFKKLDVSLEIQALIAYSGIPKATKEQIIKVRNYLENDEKRKEKILNEFKEIIFLAVDALKNKDLEMLGNLMNKNQKLLKEIRVSNLILDKMIETAVKNGALGAKITGAGGGGSIIALVTEDTKEKVYKKLQEVSKEVYSVKIDFYGVKSGKS
ncbi:MAG: mevalonate kinase [Candidatus Bathyarchaeia archaeon]